MTTVTLDITGYEPLLDQAVAINNQTLALSDPNYKPLDVQTYLQQWLTRQLEGMQPAVDRLVTMQEAQRTALSSAVLRSSMNTKVLPSA